MLESLLVVLIIIATLCGALSIGAYIADELLPRRSSRKKK